MRINLKPEVRITHSRRATEKSIPYMKNCIHRQVESRKSFFKKILLLFCSVAQLLPVSNAFLRFRLLFFLILLTIPIFSCSRSDSGTAVRTVSGRTMGTVWSVKFHSDRIKSTDKELSDLIQRRLDRINRLMSTYDPESEVSRFNASSSTEWFPVSPETYSVVSESLEISRISDGAFDITVGPAVELWGFGAKKRGGEIPDEKAVNQVKKIIGYRHIYVRPSPPAIRKDTPHSRIDLSAIAKGYAVDDVADALLKMGIVNFVAEIGGELRVEGFRPDKAAWNIAIERPEAGSSAVEKLYPLTQTAVATSGNYRNFYESNGRRYAHTIDPSTAKPVQHHLGSATILDKRCSRADALATAVMVMGEKKGLDFCIKNSIPALFLIHRNKGIEAESTPEFDEKTGLKRSR